VAAWWPLGGRLVGKRPVGSWRVDVEAFVAGLGNRPLSQPSRDGGGCACIELKTLASLAQRSYNKYMTFVWQHTLVTANVPVYMDQLWLNQ